MEDVMWGLIRLPNGRRASNLDELGKREHMQVVCSISTNDVWNTFTIVAHDVGDGIWKLYKVSNGEIKEMI